MTDRYKCGPKTQVEMEMTDRYRCGPKNSNWHGKWPIDIGTVLTQTEHKLIGKWPIDMGAAPKTQTNTKKRPIDIDTAPKNSN